MAQKLFRVIGVFCGELPELGGLRLPQRGGGETVTAMNPMPNQTVEPMTRSAVIFLFQIGRLWRAPRHGSPWRSK